MWENVQLEKMVEQAGEWACKVEWMARVDGELVACNWNMQQRCGSLGRLEAIQEQ